MEEAFDEGRRPESIEFPELPEVRRPARLSLPSGRPDSLPIFAPRRRAFSVAAVLLTLLAHVGLLELAQRPLRGPGLALLVNPNPSPPRTTRRLPVFLVDQPEAPPAEKPAPKALPSDKSRIARGGEVNPQARPGDQPRLDGNSPELVYSPNRGQGSGSAPDRRPTPTPSPGASSSSSVPDTARARPDARPRFEQPRTPDHAGRGLAAETSRAPTFDALEGGGLFGSGEIASTSGSGAATEGTVSFATSWYDWGEYAAAMLRRIKGNWLAPHALYLGVKGRVQIRFVILRSGELIRIQLISGSGTSSYDEAALAAIQSSSPLSPLPDDFPHDSEEVTINFLYNMRRVAARHDSASPPGS